MVDDTPFLPSPPGLVVSPAVVAAPCVVLPAACIVHHVPRVRVGAARFCRACIVCLAVLEDRVRRARLVDMARARWRVTQVRVRRVVPCTLAHCCSMWQPCRHATYFIPSNCSACFACSGFAGCETPPLSGCYRLPQKCEVREGSNLACKKDRTRTCVRSARVTRAKSKA